MYHYATLEDAIFKGNNYVFSVEKQINDIITRYYITFKKIDDYLNVIDKYNNCHEIVFERRMFNNCQLGRIVFDIDTVNSLPKDYKIRFQKGILKLLRERYDIYDIDIKFVWLECENKKKISKHLIINGLMFYNWSEQLKLFYEQLKYYISPSLYSTIDRQLARKNGSLRLPFNSKIGGNPLYFADSNISLKDRFDVEFKKKFCSGLIFYHDVEKREHMIEHKYQIYNDVKLTNIKTEDDDKTRDILETAYNKYFCDDDFGFEPSDYTNGFLRLKRYKPYKCLISNNVHDNDHGYLYTFKGKVFFGCFRRCVDEKGNSKKLISSNGITKFPHNKNYSMSVFKDLL